MKMTRKKKKKKRRLRAQRDRVGIESLHLDCGREKESNYTISSSNSKQSSWSILADHPTISFLSPGTMAGTLSTELNTTGKPRRSIKMFPEPNKQLLVLAIKDSRDSGSSAGRDIGLST